MDRRTIKTKKAIKRALIKLMTEKDISDITVTELAEIADVSRKTFYVHYGQLSDILDEIDDDLSSDLHREINRIKNSRGNTDFYSLFSNLLQIIRYDDEYYCLLAKSSYGDKLKDHIKVIIANELRSSFKDQFTVSPQSFNLAIEYSSAAASNFVMGWLKEKSSLDVEELSQFLAQLMDKGLYPSVEQTTTEKSDVRKYQDVGKISKVVKPGEASDDLKNGNEIVFGEELDQSSKNEIDALDQNEFMDIYDGEQGSGVENVGDAAISRAAYERNSGEQTVEKSTTKKPLINIAQTSGINDALSNDIENLESDNLSEINKGSSGKDKLSNISVPIGELTIDYSKVDISKGNLEDVLEIFKRKLDSNKLIGFDLLQIAGNDKVKQEIHNMAMKLISLNYDRNGKFYGESETVLVSMIIIALDFYDANYWNHVQNVYAPVYKGRSKVKIEAKLRSIIAHYSNNEKRYINFVIRQTITPRTYLENFIDFCFDVYKNNFKYELVEHINEYLRDIFLEINDYSDLQNADFVSNNKTYRLINTTKEIIENTEWFSELIAYTGLIIKYIDQIYWEGNYEGLEYVDYFKPIFEKWFDSNGQINFKTREKGSIRTSSWKASLFLNSGLVSLRVPNINIKSNYDIKKIKISILNGDEILAQNDLPEIKKVIGGYQISQNEYIISKPLGELSYKVTHDNEEIYNSLSQFHRKYIIFNEAGKELSNNSDYIGEISICAKSLDEIGNVDIYARTSNYLLGNIFVNKFDVLLIDGQKVRFSNLQENHIEGEIYEGTSIRYGYKEFELYKNIEYLTLITETKIEDLIVENIDNHLRGDDDGIKATKLENQYHYLINLKNIVKDGFNYIRVLNRQTNKELFHKTVFLDSDFVSSVFLDREILSMKINSIFIKDKCVTCDNSKENLFDLEFDEPHFQDKLHLLPKIDYPIYRLGDGNWRPFTDHISIKDINPYSKLWIDGIEFDKVAISSVAKKIYNEIEKISLKSTTYVSLEKLMQFGTGDLSSLKIDFIRDDLVVDSIDVYYRVVIDNKTFNISYDDHSEQAIIEFEYFGRDNVNLEVLSDDKIVYDFSITHSPVLVKIDNIKCFEEYGITITGGESDIFSLNSSQYIIYQDSVSFYTSESIVKKSFLLTQVWGEYYNPGKKIWQEEWHEFKNTNLYIDRSLGEGNFIGRITHQKKDGEYLEKIVEVELTSDIAAGKFRCSIKEDEDFLLFDNQLNSILFDESIMDKHDMPICEYNAKYLANENATFRDSLEY